MEGLYESSYLTYENSSHAKLNSLNIFRRLASRAPVLKLFWIVEEKVSGDIKLSAFYEKLSLTSVSIKFEHFSKLFNWMEIKQISHNFIEIKFEAWAAFCSFEASWIMNLPLTGCEYNNAEKRPFRTSSVQIITPLSCIDNAF